MLENNQPLITYDPILGIRNYAFKQDHFSEFSSNNTQVEKFIQECDNIVRLTDYDNRGLAQHLVEVAAGKYHHDLQILGFYTDAKIVIEIESRSKSLIIEKMLDNVPYHLLSIRLGYFIKGCKNLLQNNFIITKRE